MLLLNIFSAPTGTPAERAAGQPGVQNFAELLLISGLVVHPSPEALPKGPLRASLEPPDRRSYGPNPVVLGTPTPFDSHFPILKRPIATPSLLVRLGKLGELGELIGVQRAAFEIPNSEFQKSVRVSPQVVPSCSRLSLRRRPRLFRLFSAIS